MPMNQLTVAAPPHSVWVEGGSVVVRGERYLLRKLFLELPTHDGSAVLRLAEALHMSQNRLVQLKQVGLFRQTRQGQALCTILKKEHRLALTLTSFAEFPQVLDAEGLVEQSGLLPITLVYAGWNAYSLKQVFPPLNRERTRAEIMNFLRSFAQICSLIHHLHRQNCSHRALTTEAILFVDGDKRRPVLRDFGFAALPPRSDYQRLALIPRPAPEQLRSTIDLGIPGVRTDVYQAGVILYEALTSQPFSPSIRPSLYAQELLPEIEAILLRAVASRPKERWPTMGVFAAEIRKTFKRE